MAEACSKHGKGQNLVQSSSPKPARKKPLLRSGRNWENNIKMCIKVEEGSVETGFICRRREISGRLF